MTDTAPAAGINGQPAPNRAVRRAAGFVTKRKVLRLTFADDTEYAGLEVRARKVPLGTFLELLALADTARVGEGLSAEDLGEDEIGALKGLFTGFAEALVSWNLQEPVLDAEGEETGEVVDVPATAEGLMGQEMDLGMAVVGAWMEAVGGGVAAPLGPTSPGGSPSAEASLPMEPLSPSPAS